MFVGVEHNDESEVPVEFRHDPSIGIKVASFALLFCEPSGAHHKLSPPPRVDQCTRIDAVTRILIVRHQ